MFRSLRKDFKVPSRAGCAPYAQTCVVVFYFKNTACLLKYEFFYLISLQSKIPQRLFCIQNKWKNILWAVGFRTVLGIEEAKTYIKDIKDIWIRNYPPTE